MSAGLNPLQQPSPGYTPREKVRFVTAASLFDGHDAAINVMRRILQASGAEVIHLGHNRSVAEVVRAAVQEDAQGIALSSYQGGHMEYFRYVYDLLREYGAGHVRIFGGGGGVIVPHEQAALHAYGIDRIFSPEDGRRLGLQGMIDAMLEVADFSTVARAGWPDMGRLASGGAADVARAITLAEGGRLGELALPSRSGERALVVGLTGTGGAGKSSLTDELLLRLLRDFPSRRFAILAVDPSRRRTGGALLGDRIRLNSLDTDRVYMRSLATRESRSEVASSLDDAVAVCQAAGFDLILVETSGIGQGDAAITEHCDASLYVMTSEFGAHSQLEKIEMLDYAELVAINKFDRAGSEDALRAVRKQVRRNRQVPYGTPDEALPVFGTMASHFHDGGVNALYARLLETLEAKGATRWPSRLRPASGEVLAPTSGERQAIIPPERSQYLAEIAASVRGYHRETEREASAAQRAQHLTTALEVVSGLGGEAVEALQAARAEAEGRVSASSRGLLAEWPELKASYAGRTVSYAVRGRTLEVEASVETLSGTRIPKVALPKTTDAGELLRWLRSENLPGRFPFTAGLYPFRREGEEPMRQFAGEGTPEQTNRRFHYLCEGTPSKRLSTAFDSVTLYGEDPHERPDIYGKIGESGVSVCTLDDMKQLYAGFDLCAPDTSVSMTINGPAPIILALFFNTAIDQQVERFEASEGRAATASERESIAARTLQVVRGTVQADILKEDQAQNTCIFSTEFALRMMGDIQEFFIQKGVRNYYSVSISGYHIAEAGANPISQLAFTLANGFTYVESYLRRGMEIDAFAPNLSFFFSNGLDPEYTVLGRVARRIWAVAMRDLYGGSSRSQQLKYHIQTSGRSLHAQEIQFNDIRTTLQALLALWDSCNSLHTNAYDEAITTPTEESVRRAAAIQLIINREYGLTKNENPWQGSFIVEELTALVEEAVLQEFERLARRGGVLPAMELQYQRGRIQDESMLYEMKKHSGELPIIGVNTFLSPAQLRGEYELPETPLSRATPEQKQGQIDRLRAFQARHAAAAPGALARLQEVATGGGNIFAELMQTARVASLGQITHALYEVGGRYRRNM